MFDIFSDDLNQNEVSLKDAIMSNDKESASQLLESIGCYSYAESTRRIDKALRAEGLKSGLENSEFPSSIVFPSASFGDEHSEIVIMRKVPTGNPVSASKLEVAAKAGAATCSESRVLRSLSEDPVSRFISRFF